MGSQIVGALGILELQQGATPRESPEPHPENVELYGGVPLISEVVAGAWAEDVIRGNPGIEGACIVAARRLVNRGAAAITSDCGFFVRHQNAVAASVRVPVVMSSLLLAPMLLRQLPRDAKLAVLTADARHCSVELLGLNPQNDRARVVIGGIEGSKVLDELNRPYMPKSQITDTPQLTNAAALEKEVIASLDRLRAEHPQVSAVLLECTAFSLVAPSIRSFAKLPVYDIGDLCRMTLSTAYRGIGGGEGRALTSLLPTQFPVEFGLEQ
ncbi:hypothetical protein [Mesorhizobium sp. M0037]|uniref:hypothetical protein n=1 Tax=unclassified Mesorhizobium TaxID=325217 RepID=UPI003334BF73